MIQLLTQGAGNDFLLAMRIRFSASVMATALTLDHTECFDYISPNGTKSLFSGDMGNRTLRGCGSVRVG